MNNLLVICGPTATGKTSLALGLVKKFKGELISADSRQVYTHMDVVTGKDIPDGFDFRPSDKKIPGMSIGYYTNGKVKIWGHDLVTPDQNFSAKLYKDFSHVVIRDIIARNKLPIVVGGTGFFIRSVIEKLDRIDIPKDERLRKELNGLSADKLFMIFMKTNPKKAQELNDSEKRNARRLIRHLEVDKYEKIQNLRISSNELVQLEFDNLLKIGLYYRNRDNHEKAIDKRTKVRISEKLEKEISFLKKKDYLNYAPKDTIGYREWIGYLNGEYSKSAAIKKWKRAECQYAKRQMTWFQKQKEINWFDVQKKGYINNVEKLVWKWHNGLDQ
ncbi:tRNA (adenosine(37)-N6)-dimethylallyltransferase [Patescibacteria group bacterium]